MPYYITTPIYYVNAEPHLGHAYTTIAADILARHMRQRGEDVFFLTGTDEHGEPVAQAAERLGVSPRELADKNSERFRDLVRRIDATNDFFIRTSDPEHEAAVQEVVQRIYDNDYVYEGTYEGYYCPRCADFKSDADRRRQQVPDPPHPARAREGGQLVLQAVGLPGAARTALRGAARLGNARRALQRGALVHQAGPERHLPLTRAPALGRAGAVGRVAGDLRLVRRAAQLRTRRSAMPALARTSPTATGRHRHLIGKDILKFHAVIWPAMLWPRASRRRRASTIHGYLLMDEHKMSKSLGNVLTRSRDRPLRHRHAALTCFRSGLRHRRLDLGRRLRGPLQPSWPTTTATSPAACWR